MSKTVRSCVWVLDDDRQHLQQVGESLERVKDVSVKLFESRDQFLEGIGLAKTGRCVLPVVVIVDNQLPGRWGDSLISLLRTNEDKWLGPDQTALKESGETGVFCWRILISALGKDKAENVYYHFFQDKNAREWPDKVASIVAGLVEPQARLDVGDLAPLIITPPHDRICVFSSRQATQIGLDVQDQLTVLCPYLLPPHHWYDIPPDAPLISWRGRFVALRGPGLQKLAAALLKIRVVCQQVRDDFPSIEICTNSELGEVETRHGLPRDPAAINANLLSRKVLDERITRLFDSAGAGEIDANFPLIHVPGTYRDKKYQRGTRELRWIVRTMRGDDVTAARTELDEIWRGKHAPLVRCPAYFRDEGSAEGSRSFWARAQFVLTPEEIEEFKRWKSGWEALSGLWVRK